MTRQWHRMLFAASALLVLQLPTLLWHRSLNSVLQHRSATTNPIAAPVAEANAKLPNAYAFLIAGCDPDNARYHGFLYNIVLAMYTLRRSGSTADFVVMIQMSARTNYTTLTDQDLAILSKLNDYGIHNNSTKNSTTEAGMVHVKYLPKPRVDSFYQANMMKFAILNLTEYNRVVYMDADILPLCNLDYLFDFSEQGFLKDNVVLAGSSEPANGGLFMLRPLVGDYEQLLSIIQRQHDRVLQSAWHNAFDPDVGWGHVIQSPDELIMVSKRQLIRSTSWKFHGGFADQGLLYYWAKYVKMSVSIIMHDVVQNWVSPTGNRYSENATVNPVMESNASTVNMTGFGCPVHYRIHPSTSRPPFKDHYHFTGKKKPWERRQVPQDIPSADKAAWPQDLWFHWLRQANVDLALNLNISTILSTKEPALGRYPTHSEVAATARATNPQANLTAKQR